MLLIGSDLECSLYAYLKFLLRGYNGYYHWAVWKWIRPKDERDIRWIFQ